jgi:phosphoenolpyruvate phosphomutase
MLVSDELEFMMEAHNGLSARIVREAGFKGIWASGLAISAQFGVRDNNEASWTQVVDNLEFMADASDLPILLDGDTGYGNFNNVRRLVRKLEQRGIAGVCIEDKIFPKTNSFIGGERSRWPISTSSAARSRPARIRRPTTTSRSSRASKR